MKRAVADSVDAIAEMIELETDLMWRYLIDRDTLSASAALVINRLYREGPMRLTALAEAEGASQSGMTQLVQRMERQGLLERWSDPDDGRASLVMLGDAGLANWEARAALRRQRIAALLPAVSPDDQLALWLAAQVVNRVLGQMREAAGSQDWVDAEVVG
ncbi:MarR family transcriptional regulator [Mycolicibacterium madagascariense]|uniref:MarR family transcriptional regulator n=1 Tax=Mycolicibacterium madagascariense TaxID=212765 RepID=A0A7I7XE10_9MYCO|nr:MarR family transcriptional regulator [Mycolicibacterium madagascariense]MCV7015334.1 MarR family transcriptional regulator [Mycolicibacterium madagascariense]BBZ27630.1 MarR family transcriptional regulator [Mycolicibacterium madagascariense]